MQIGSAVPYVPAMPSTPTARPPAPDVSPDLLRADQAPASPVQSSSAQGQADLREESDKASEGEDRKGASTEAATENPTSREAAELREEQAQISELASRDREVRTHEQAHAAVGGAYAGAPTYTFKRGPDGKSYATGGEVGIDTSAVPGDPEATLRKMEVVVRAALAPAEPSAQDRSVAAQAQAQAAAARVELSEMRREESAQALEARADEKKTDAAGQEEDESTDDPKSSPSLPGLDLYRSLARGADITSSIDMRA